MSGDRLFRALMRLYPAAYRDAYGESMAETYAWRAAEARARGRLMLWFHLRELAWFGAAGMRARLAQAGGGVFERSATSRGSDVTIEVRYAVRRLVRTPGFTLAAVLTLGVAIGATTAIYALVDGILLRPLRYPASDRLVLLDHGAPGLDLPRGVHMSDGLYVHYRRNARAIESIGIYTTLDRNLTGEGAAERVRVVYATPSMGTVLRARPLIGRWLLEEEGDGRWGAVVVLSEGFWRRRFGGDPVVLGRTIHVNGRPFEVVGVMPAAFAFPDSRVALWAPLGIDAARARVGGLNYTGIARLRDGATLDGLSRELNALIASAPSAFAGDPFARELVEGARLGAAPVAYKDSIVGAIRRTLWVLLGTVSVVLLIACANVANLFLVRAEGRRIEVAVRRALGAGRARIAGNYLTEALLLSLGGAVVGATLSWAAVRLLVAQGTERTSAFSAYAMLPRLQEVGFDVRAVAFALLCALVAGLVFGAVPLIGSRELTGALRDAGRRSTASRRRLRLRDGLVVVQIALAFILLVAGGLMVRSFAHLNRVDPGFNAEGLLTFQVMLDGVAYPDRASAVAYHETLIQRLEAMPGVERASAANTIPLGGSIYNDPLMVEGRPIPEGTVPPLVAFRRVMPEYFEVMGIPLVQGRGIDKDDHRARTGAAVISQELARVHFSGEDPIGKRIYWIETEPADVPWYTVVGVVGNLPVTSLMGERPAAAAYLPALHTSQDGPPTHMMTFAVRSAVPPLSLVPAIRTLVRELDATVPLANVQTMQEVMSAAGARLGFTMMLLVTAAAAALLLGAIGIYGVISYLVSRRTGEIGIRLALGARPADVARMVVRHGAAIAAIGLTFGFGGALATVHVIEGMLFGVAPGDLPTYLMVASILGGIALLACWLPARRAARLSPLRAMGSGLSS